MIECTFSGFIAHLCEEYQDLVDESILDVKSYTKHIVNELSAFAEVEIDLSDAAELLMGKADLSQRGYKHLRGILKENKILLPDYQKVRHYVSDVDVGKIEPMSCENNCCCMGVKTKLKETLQRIVSTNALFSLFQFFSKEKQIKLFSFLKKKNSQLYANLDCDKRTIVIRDTGDNFRAACRFPTEQTSYSILNLEEMINNPYGQFVSTLWRGSESRSMLKVHVSDHYNELHELVLNGIDLIIEGAVEHFNIIIFFVADLCFIKDIIGQCQSTSTYGCYHCSQPIHKWMSTKKEISEPKEVATMVRIGNDAIKSLDENIDRTSKKFKDLQLANKGQWVCYRVLDIS